MTFSPTNALPNIILPIESFVLELCVVGELSMAILAGRKISLKENFSCYGAAVHSHLHITSATVPLPAVFENLWTSASSW